MATAQMTNNTHSVHALVRLLKSATDPPSIPGPSKIELACLAWLDSSFVAANKGEVIGEWVLTQLGQAKKSRRGGDANHISDPITDSRYWSLLCGVLTTPLPTAARPIKTWLLPLLNRIQLDTIVVQLLALHSSPVLAPARVALAVLWPLAEKKIAVDALEECLSAVFDACTEWERVDDNLGWVCSAAVSAYRNALTNTGNKKKLYNSFLTTHISSWLSTICTGPSIVSSSSTKQLQDSIYAAGADTLFSLDALKQPLDTLFAALSSSAPLISSLLPVLPRVFTSFLSATHRHRSALFVSASSAVGGKEEIRKRGMDFVGRCWTLIWGSASPQMDCEVEKWKSVIGVFEIVGNERLFVSHFVRGTRIDTTNGEYGGELALSEARDKAVEILETLDASSKDSRAELAVLSIRLLDVLVRIEHDFIGSVLERILSALINIPPPLFHLVTIPASEFLIRVLEYHTKTRTVHTYTLALLSAVVASSASSTSWTFSSPTMKSTFPLAYHLPALARALHTSLTPTQTAPLAIAVLQTVESAWKAFKDAYQEEEGAAKKRKVTEDTHKSGHEARMVPAQAQVFSYASHVAGVVLSNFPANAYTEDQECSLETLWADVGKLGWTVVWDCLKEMRRNGEEHNIVNGRDGKKRKHAVETGAPSTVYPQIVTSAALRFLYDVRARVSRLLGGCDQLEEVRVGTLLNVVRDEASDPELVLETIRTLLWHMWYTHNCDSQKQMETEPIFTVTLDILTTCPLSKAKWSGVSAALTRDNLGLAALYVLADRWIHVLDALASTENLKRLISVFLAVSLDLPDEDTREKSNDIYLQQDHVTITLRGILLDLLRNAQFWELHNIRAVFLSSVLTLTAPLSFYRSRTPGVESPSSATAAAQTELTLACNVYRLLYYVPPEYFIRPVRAELVKRAMAGDVQICTELGGVNRQKSKVNTGGSNASQGRPLTEEMDGGVPAELKKWSRRLTFVRVFLQRMEQFLNTSGHTTSFAFVNHLLTSPSCVFTPSEVLTTATLNLIQLHVVNLLRSQETEAAASISSIISTVIAARPFSQPNCQETWTHIVVQPSVLKLIERLTSDFDPASLPDRVKHALKTLLEALESALLPHARRSVERDTTKVDEFLSSGRINAWSRTLSLTRWLGMNFQVASTPLGLKLATSTIRSENPARLDSDTYSSILSLLLEELWCMPDVSHRGHLDVLVAFYTINGGDRGSDIERTMDAHITQSSKKLSVEDFSYLLDILAEGIGGSGLRTSQRERLTRLGKIILHDTPQGTLKVIQNFATRCFNLFADREDIHEGSSRLKLRYLEFIAKHCSDRPAAIRSVDLGNIWSLLSKILSGSSEHDATTVFPIFHHIVTIIGALIRLRRDLVVHTLPHLSLVLRQLMMLNRKIRPQLGAKQSKIVTDTFPSWLSASQPLSTDEARAFARLLTSLTTKTIPRTHTYGRPQMSTDSQKAESLAKPFAKHASYVLIAYVDAFNDPLCIINAEMRRDLEPGLFALCEMVGEYSRDALMVSALDSGGKTILKSLWKEYEKQRYVGRG